MYIIKLINGEMPTTIHNDREKLKSGSIVKGINTIDSFSFSLYPSNPGFNQVHDYLTLVSVYNTNQKRYEFHGRVLYSCLTMDESGLIYRDVVCESCFGFLCDSQQPYVDTRNWTVAGLLGHLIEQHNAQLEDYKHFTLGEVTATDPNDNLYQGIQREDTWTAIKNKLLDKIGGELRFRVEDGVNYIDYLDKIGETRTTAIELSRNMQSISREIDPTELITRLIPLGAKIKDADGNDTEQRIDITSVNDGKNYIDVEGVGDTKSIRVGYAYFDGVTLPANLLAKGQAYLAENNKIKVKYTAKALDLSLLGLDIDDFNVHDYHPIKNPLLGIDDTARIIKKNINVCEEIQSSIEFGEQFKGLTDIQRDQAAEAVQRIEAARNDLKNYVASAKTDLNERIEGIDGVYFYIKYSAYSDGHVMTDTPQDDTAYMGTYSAKASEDTAPTDHTLYTWSRIKGEKGDKGDTGAQGEQGIQGEPGADGAAGADGKSVRLFTTNYSYNQTAIDRYAADTYAANWAVNESTDGLKVGDTVHLRLTNTTRNAYCYIIGIVRGVSGSNINMQSAGKIESGEPGAQGIQGDKGEKGDTGNGIASTSCTYQAGTSGTTAPTGTWLSSVPSVSAGQYLWTKTVLTYTDGTTSTSYSVGRMGVDGAKGDKGDPGETGADGKTQYLHIKYSDDGETFTANNGETLGAYIGTLVDFTETDSTTFSDYTWKKFTEDVDEELDDIRQTMSEKHTSIINDCENIIMSALETYTETSNFEQFKRTVESELKLLNDELTLKFSETETKIENVDGDLQSKFNSITKYFTFDIDGLIIGQVDNPYKMILDNDRFSMTVNGVEVMWIADGEVHTPEISITKGFKLFDYLISVDNDGNVNGEYVGGD